MTLEEALEAVAVHHPDDLLKSWWDAGPCPHPPGFWGVSMDRDLDEGGSIRAGGVFAYFHTEQLALRYRLDSVNRLLNG